MKKILIVHNKYRHLGGEDIAVEREISFLKKRYEFFYLKNLFLFGIVFILLLFYFSYERDYSGGIFYRLSNLIFDNNITFYIISSTSLLILFLIFGKKISKKVS